MKKLICVLLSIVLLMVFSIANVYGYCEGFADCEKKANQGNAEAQFNLGVMHRNGDGVVQDNKEAVKWYRKAAEQGYDLAQNKGLS